MPIKNLYICKLLYGWRSPILWRAMELGSSSPIGYKKALERILDAEKLKYCFECGICTASCSIAELLGNEYNPRALLEQICLNPESALSSDELWLCGWCYRCQKRCPQGLKLPEIFMSIRAVAKEHGNIKPLEKALQKIVKNIPLPLVATLVCFHPERVGLEYEKVLERIEQIRGEWFKAGKTEKQTVCAEKVAVLGSGPAGLTVAYELTRKGCSVTIFEALQEAGGMLKKCIPEFRLPKKVLDKEIDFIKKTGVGFKTGVQIGKDISIKDLKQEGYNAVFVGTGAHKSQGLKVEGKDLDGVVDALDFLRSSKCGNKIDGGKNVAVIGGGNVAVDAARAALCQKGNNVKIFYRRSRDEMPANLYEVKEAEEEGVKIEFLASPKRILGERGRVSGVEYVRMQLGEPDESGRRKASPVDGSEFTEQTEMVILAIGEVPDLRFLPEQVDRNDDGTVWVNPLTMETSMPGIFAGGDAVSGPASVIEAIRDGKRAAESIETYLHERRVKR